MSERIEFVTPVGWVTPSKYTQGSYLIDATLSGRYMRAVNPYTGEARCIRYFSDDIEHKTRNCLTELHNTTTEAKLLKAAGGNKWVARRAIELYKLGMYI